MILYCDDCGRMTTMATPQIETSRQTFGGPYCTYCGSKVPDINILEPLPEGGIEDDEEAEWLRSFR